jgi:hypothetical protein
LPLIIRDNKIKFYFRFMLSQIKFGYVLKFLIGFIDTLSFTISENFALSRNIKFYDFLTHFHFGEDVLLVYVCTISVPCSESICGNGAGCSTAPDGRFSPEKKASSSLDQGAGCVPDTVRTFRRGEKLFLQLEMKP